MPESARAKPFESVGAPPDDLLGAERWILQQEVAKRLAVVTGEAAATLNNIDQVLTDVGPDSDWHLSEVYARSLRPMERWGKVMGAAALSQTIEVDEEITTLLYEEAERLEKSNWEDFGASLVEMMSTDMEYREKLEVTRVRTYNIRDNKVVFSDSEGAETPAADMLQRGAEASEKAALKDPRMRFQARRDKHDVANAMAVDGMAPGMTRIVVLMDPKRAYQEHGKDFVNGMGYREGWVSVQAFRKHEAGDKVTAFTYTLNHGNTAVMRKIMGRRGTEVPEDVHEDDFIKYAIEIPCGTDEEVHEFLSKMRDESYGEQGIVGERFSVDDFLKSNESVVRQIFETQYKPLAMALHDRAKTPEIQSFVEIILAGGLNLKDEIRSHLTRICGRDVLDKADINQLDYLIHYATVEQLRPVLRHLGTDKLAVVRGFEIIPGQPIEAAQIAYQLANRAVAGINAGRTYGGGGCKPADLVKKDKKDGLDSVNPMDAYGGRDGEEDKPDKPESSETELKCVKCPLCGKDGVDAKIEFHGNVKRITCKDCKQHKDYPK